MTTFPIRLLTLIFAALLGGCYTQEDLDFAIAEYEERISYLESQLSDAESATNDLLSTIDDLESAVSLAESEVEDFAYEDWRINVPEVEYAIEEIRIQITPLRSSADDLERALLP